MFCVLIVDILDLECIAVFWVGELDSGGRALHKLNRTPRGTIGQGGQDSVSP